MLIFNVQQLQGDTRLGIFETSWWEVPPINQRHGTLHNRHVLQYLQVIISLASFTIVHYIVVFAVMCPTSNHVPYTITCIHHVYTNDKYSYIYIYAQSYTYDICTSISIYALSMI